MESIQSEEQDSVLYPALSKEIPPTKSGFNTFKIIITSIAFFVLFNIFYFFLITQYDFNVGIARKWRLIDILDKPVDVVILGDSVSNAGIDPRVIEAETGKTAANLALNAGWTFYNDVWMLERYIEKFGAPSTLIWGQVYDKAPSTFNPLEILSASSAPYGFSWQSQYLDVSMSLEEKAQLIIMRAFPLYFRDETTKIIFQDLLSFENPIDDFMRLSELKGFGDAHDTLNIEQVTAMAQAIKIRPDYDVSEDSLNAINALVQIVDKYQIPTYIFNTPLHPIIGTNKEFQTTMQSQREFWNQLALEHPSIHYNPEIPLYEPEYLYEPDHLNVFGAKIYTKYLADWIWGDYQPASLHELEQKQE